MTGIIILSILLGIFFAVFTFIICSFVSPESAFACAIFAGAVFTLLCSICMSISQKRANKRYAAVEKELAIPFFYKSNGNFKMGTKVDNGTVYFCEDKVVFVFLRSRNNICEEVEKNNIERFEFDKSQTNLYTKDGRSYFMLLNDFKTDLKALLTEKNWI